MDIVTQRDSLWSKSRLYQFSEHYKPFVLSVLKGEFWMNDRFKELLEEKGYVLMARSNPRFDSLIKRIPGEKQVYLSMWDGYVDKSKAAYNEQLVKSLGKGYLRMHTSGHCDMNSLREVFRLLHPKAIVPIHTEKPEDFAQLFGDEWSVVVLNDGESISSISSGTADAHDSKVVLKK